LEEHPMNSVAVQNEVPATGLSKATGRLAATFREGGAWYSLLYGIRLLGDKAMGLVERQLVGIERRKEITAPWSLSAHRFTAADNKALWNTYDWSQRGEEWTKSEAWKQGLIREYLFPNVPENCSVVEVGPGGGRWTQVLKSRCALVTVVDVSERALAICRERFGDASNIEYRLSDGRTIAVPAASVDAFWSYDVFVHINPADARGYFAEMSRILKPGARAVVHHPDVMNEADRQRRWRSDLTGSMTLGFASAAGLRLISQTREYVNQGDALSVFEKV
jgi:SAM-dependent methyltransferase